MSTTERTFVNPVYAFVGAGDLVAAQVNEFYGQLRERTETVGETAQARFDETRTRITAIPEELPTSLEDLRTRFSPEELRKLADSYLETVTDFYNSLTERGVDAVDRFRQQPVVQSNIDRAEKAYNGAVDLTEDALGRVSSQTRSVGERAVKLTSFAGDRVRDAADAVEDAVEETGTVINERTDAAAKEITGLIGTVEGKARTAADSPAKKAEAAKTAPAKKAPARKPAAKKAPAKKAPAKKATN